MFRSEIGSGFEDPGGTPPPRIPRSTPRDLGLDSDAITRRLKSCVNKFYGFVTLRVVFQNTCRIKSFFPYKDRFNRSQKSKIVYKASCWDCDAFYIGKTKRRLHDRKTEHFKLVTPPLLLSIRFPLVTTSNGTILRS